MRIENGGWLGFSEGTIIICEGRFNGKEEALASAEYILICFDPGASSLEPVSQSSPARPTRIMATFISPYARIKINPLRKKASVA